MTLIMGEPSFTHISCQTRSKGEKCLVFALGLMYESEHILEIF